MGEGQPAVARTKAVDEAHEGTGAVHDGRPGVSCYASQNNEKCSETRVAS